MDKKEVAKALVFIDNELLDMGDFYSETVEYLCDAANIDFDYDGDLNSQAINAYEILANKKSKSRKIISLLEYLFDEENESIDILKGRMQYYDNTEPLKHPIVLALNTLLDYVKELTEEEIDTGRLLTTINNVIVNFSDMDLEAIRIGYLIGHEYYKYLNPEYFGVITNDYFKVGHTYIKNENLSIIIQDKDVYCAHAEYNRLNTPHNGFAVLFKRNENNQIMVNIIPYERDKSFQVVYKNSQLTFPVNLKNVEESSKKIAKIINDLAKKDIEKMVLI